MAEEIKDGMEQETERVEETKEKETDNVDTELSLEDKFNDLQVKFEKMKMANDKNSSEAADYKKKWKASLSESELLSQEKAEAQARKDADYENLKKQVEVNNLEKNFLQLGYSSEMATRAANAQYDNDTSEIFKIQKEYQDIQQKKFEEDFYKNNPNVRAGNKGNEDESDPILKGFNSDIY